MRSIVADMYLWACERLYHELAWIYDSVSWFVSAGRWSTWRGFALDYLPPGRVLEIGFGTGELLIALAARSRRVYGVELSTAMHRITRRKLRKRGLSAMVGRSLGTAQRLPFADGCFAAVVATFPAGYMFDPTTAGEIARVLQPPRDEPARTGDGASPPLPAGCLVVGGLAVTIDDPRLARLAPLFYGAPAPRSLDRWQATLTAAGLQPQLIDRPAGGTHVLMLVAEKQA